LSLPLTKDEFTEDKQRAFITSLAAAAGASPTDVKIDKIETISGRRADRRLLAGSIRVDASVKVADSSAANALANSLSADKINAELAKAGLPPSTMLEPPTASGGNSKSENNLLLLLLLLLLVPCLGSALFFYYKAPAPTVGGAPNVAKEAQTVLEGPQYIAIEVVFPTKPAPITFSPAPTTNVPVLITTC
jgi:hypothetical protein